jgi:hypothetical protein
VGLQRVPDVQMCDILVCSTDASASLYAIWSHGFIENFINFIQSAVYWEWVWSFARKLLHVILLEANALR